MKESRVLPRLLAAATAASWIALGAPASAANFCVSNAAGLTQAMSLADNGQDDTIQLVQGTYVGNFLHTANVSEDLRVEGGYLPGCASRVVDPANTVIDGNATGRALYLYSNFVVSFTVDGVTVRNGRALGPNIFGAGLIIVVGNQPPAGGAIAVTNCIIRDNVAAQDGGGMYLQKADSVTVSNSVIQDNTGGFGGGMYLLDNANVTLSGNFVSGNGAFYSGGQGTGGGMYVDMTFPNRGGSGSAGFTATGNTFTQNSAAVSGGGFFICSVPNAGGTNCSALTGWTSSIVLTGNVVSSNSAGTGAGSLLANGNSVLLDANTWTGNSGSNGGGAAFVDLDLLTMTNNLVYGNQATSSGAGLVLLNVDTLTATNNTLTGNSAPGGGFAGGFFAQIRDDSDSAALHNNIVWGNAAGGGADDIFIDNNGNGNGVFSAVALQNNDFDQGPGGFVITQPGFVIPASNLNDVDPLFVNPAGGNYRLQAASACRDTGNNGAPALPPLDHDFLPRVVGGTVDMGAYEFQSADLAITKTDGQATEVPGTSVTYTITVTNGGPSPVPTATVTDTPPAILTGVAWTCAASAGSSCPASGNGAINHVASVAVGGTLTYSLTGTISPSATGTLVNTASVAAPAGIPDPNPGNNSATDTDTLTPQADLAATKTDSQTSAVPGLPITYQMTVTSAGPSSVTGATVSDTVPGVLTGVTWSCSASGGSSCPTSGSGSINHGVNLAPGGVLTYALTGTIASSATGTLTNTVSVTAPGGLTDPVGGNNSATDIDTLFPQRTPHITKTDGQNQAPPGTAVTYTIVASNLGPSDGGGVVMDTFPSDLLGVSWTCTPSGGATCENASGNGDFAQIVGLPAGAAATYVASGTVDPGATGTLVNLASLLVSPETVFAIDVDIIVLPGLSELGHGSAAVRSLASTGPGTPAHLYWIRQAPRSSYEVVVDAVTGDVADPAGDGPDLDLLSADTTTVVLNSTAAGAGASRSLRFTNNSDVPDESNFVRVQSAGCTAACGPEDVYRIRAWETTYHVARYNNSSSQITVLLVENGSASPVVGVAWFWSSTGTLLGSQAFAVDPKALFTLNTATVAPGSSGSVTISNDGPYGALTGKAVAVEPTTGFSFDTPLQPKDR